MSTANSSNRSISLAIMMVILGMAYFFSNFHRMALSVIGGTVAGDFSLSAAQLGALGSAIFYTYAAMQIPCGAIADQTSSRLILTLSCVLTAASTAWFAFSNSFASMILARGLTGISTALVYVPALTTIRRQFGEHAFGTMSGILTAMGQMGTLCASMPLKFLADTLHWRIVFLLIGGISLLLSAGCWIFIPHSAPPARQRSLPVNTSKQAPSLWKICLTPSCFSLVLWFFLAGGTRLSFQSLWASRFLTQALDYSEQTSSFFLLVISLGCIIGPICLGLVSDRAGSFFTVGVSTLLFSAVWLCLSLLSPGAPAWTTILLAFAFGAFGSGSFTIGFSCLRRFSRPQNSGILTGINNCFAFLGSACFTQASGIFMEYSSGLGAQEQYRILLMAFSALCLAATALVVFFNRSALRKS